MKDLNISRFREHCAYCWRGLELWLVVCRCGLVLCIKHQKLHLGKKDHNTLYFIKRIDGTLSVYSTKLSKEHCLEIETRVSNLLNHGDADDEDVFFGEKKFDCLHVSGSSKRGINSDKREDKCGACGLESNLWSCLECGYIGCGREQYGIEGSGHALCHFQETSHPVSAFIRDLYNLEPKAVFCYVCDSFVAETPGTGKNRGPSLKRRDPDANVRARTALGGSSKRMAPEQHEMQPGGKHSKYVGIENQGNTCYISSVMQMIAHTVDVKRLETHFRRCAAMPLECILCQTVRVLTSIKSGTFVPIVDFIELIFESFPVFKKNAQQDASEFFIYLINQIKTAESEGCMRKITGIMDYELNNIIECSCGLLKRRKEDSFFLNIPFEQKVSRGLKSYLEPVSYSCECGGIGKNISYFRILPEYLFVIVNRCGDDGMKIKDSLLSDELAIQNFLETVPDQKHAESLAMLGFGRKKVADALVLNDNDADAACNTLLSRDTFNLRTKKTYKMHSAVCHRGDNVTSGHYTWIKKEGSGLVHVDDESVRTGTEDTLCKAYIICYH